MMSLAAFLLFAAVQNPCGLGSDRYANWISLGETITFTNRLSASAAMEGVVTDTTGAVVYRGAAEGRAWTWKPERAGFYSVSFTAVQKGERRPVELALVLAKTNRFPRTSFAIAVSPRPPRTPEEAPPQFGFNLPAFSSHLPRLELGYQIARLTGMNAFLRLHYLMWDRFEKTEGLIDWSHPDLLFEFCKAHGYGYDRLLVNVFGTPVWLSSSPNKGATAHYSRPALYAPTRMEPVETFFRALCERYRGIRHVEVWNEPHLPGCSVFWQNGTPEQFVDLLRHARRGIKAVDPTIDVVMGGIGRRYLPFYERIVPLGAVDLFDTLGTHCGYDLRCFRDVERRNGAPSKPYWEDEWHCFLYNCREPEPPSEEEGVFRMLSNFAALLDSGAVRITGFGDQCGEHVPETAAYFAARGGIQQVCGLFRSEPMVEPRLVAFALRTATDLFAGRVKRRGAWRLGEDGRYYVFAAESDRGTVAFVWTPARETPKGAVPREFGRLAANRRVLDCEGRETSFAAFEPRRVYFVLDPDLSALAKLPQAPTIAYSASGVPKEVALPADRERGTYGPLGEVRPLVLSGSPGATVSVQAGGDGLRLRLTLPGGERLKRFGLVLDTEDNGIFEDIVEFSVSPDGTVVKPRTPALKGDIPSDWSPANVALKHSRARFEDGAWTIALAAGDLFPFAYSDGKALPLSLAVETDRGRRIWGGGWTGFIEAARFGRLFPGGGGRVIGRTADATKPFCQAEVSLKDGVVSMTPRAKDGTSGISLPISYVPGSVIAYRGEVRGDPCKVIVGAWAEFGKGVKPQRCNGSDVTCLRDWAPFSGSIVLPAGSSRGKLNFFTFKNATAVFEIRNLEVVNE